MMACKFEYNGKTYDQDGLVKALEQMPPHEAHKYIPGVKNIPDAPFKKTWHELALKRMIREAAEKGYDRLSWTPGEAQAARYDLSKHLDKVQYHADKHRLVGIDKNGGVVMDKEGVSPEQVSDYVGKDVAKKLLESEPAHIGKIHELRGANLSIGGEGMKGFYDQIMPKALEKISGEKVKTANVKKDSYTQTSNGYVPSKENIPIHYIDIPQSLKDKAMSKGFPLFSSTHMFTPISGDPFKSDKSK